MGRPGDTKRFLVGISSLNEGDKIRRVIERFSDYDSYDVLIVDDGSTDGSLEYVPPHLPLKLIRNERTMGAGYTTRQTLDFALEHGYEAVFLVSGNDKDSPEDIVKLRTAIEAGNDLVQGSRYLAGGRHGGMPFYRKVATRLIHPLLFSLITGRWITDSTNGFRAVRTSMLADSRLNLRQSWLDQYELEPYLFYQAIKLGYKVVEVPVSKIYPPKAQGYTKMKPVSGWWSILRPLVYLGLGIKK